ncbi:MAG: flavin reductase family protein [Candidatus Kapabacteria bacterium]|nr:flavin reductase family protein [Candidatus Kapabacteria bacterium]
MRTILPDELSHRDRHQLLLSGVSPRPIAFVSSIDAHGVSNLAPYSFFNAFASKPPIVAIGPAIAAKTGRVKDTWANIMATGECTINAVSYAMSAAMNITSSEYGPEVDEFIKAGFTKAPSTLVKPPFVAEAPFAMECRLMENIELRRDIGGNGNLMLLEVVAFHVADSVMVDGVIDPRRMDLVARMGGSYYARAHSSVIFEQQQPPRPVIGLDALPDHIRTSPVLTGRDLAILASVPELPMYDGSFPRFDTEFRADAAEIELAAGNAMAALYVLMNDAERRHDRIMLHRIAACFLAHGKIDEAWQTLLME